MSRSGGAGRAFGGDQRLQRGDRCVRALGSRRWSDDAVLVGLGLQGLVEDLAGAQRLADTVEQAVQPFLDHGLHIDFEQQIAAAAQVKSKMNGAPGHPGGRGGE